MDIYREEILEHWRNPQNSGEIKNADLVIDQVNPLCGDEVTFYFKFDRGPVSSFPPTSARSKQKSKSYGKLSVDLRAVGSPSTTATPLKIADVKFSGNGCAISVATSSMLSEFIKGKSIKVISKITGENVLGLIGGNVAPARLKCAFLPLEAIRLVQGKLVRKKNSYSV